MLTNRLVTIDLETGGLDAERNALLSVGACEIVRGENGTLALGTSRYWRIRPAANLSATAEALAVNGLDDWADADGKTDETSAWINVSTFVGFAPMIAHNAAFDTAFLSAWKRRIRGYDDSSLYSRGLRPAEMLCTRQMVMLAQATGRMDAGSTSLDGVANHYGLSRTSPTHNAEEDARLCAHIYIRLLQVLGLEAAQ